jgi:hypothetical protein
MSHCYILRSGIIAFTKCMEKELVWCGAMWCVGIKVKMVNAIGGVAWADNG